MNWHPLQPLYIDSEGVVRFRGNKIVSLLLDTSKFDLNDLSVMLQNGVVSKEDFTQLMQLIGYSVSGYGDLSTSPKELVEEADRQAEELLKGKR